MPKVLIQSVQHPSRTKQVPEGEARLLVRLGRWHYATAALPAGPPPVVAPDPVPEPQPESVLPEPVTVPEPVAEPDEEPSEPEAADSGPLDGIKFANKLAAEAARAAGLTANAFVGREPSGANGGYTKPDVLEIVKDWA